MQTIKASECKAKFLKIIDEVAASGEPIIVTKHGKAVAQIVPNEPVKRKLPFNEILGCWKGKIHYDHDIVGPIPEEWYAREYPDDHLW